MQTFSQKSNRRRKRLLLVFSPWLNYLNHGSWTETVFCPSSSKKLTTNHSSFNNSFMGRLAMTNLNSLSFISKPSQSDAKEVVRLIQDLRDNHNAKMLPRKVTFYLNNKTIVAKNYYGSVVGVVSSRFWEDNYIEVVSQANHPKYQGIGLGNILFEKLKGALGIIDYSHFFCFTNQVGFYERLGFVKTDPTQFSRKIQSDCDNCRLGLNGPGNDPCVEFAMIYHGDD